MLKKQQSWSWIDSLHTVLCILSSLCYHQRIIFQLLLALLVLLILNSICILLHNFTKKQVIFITRARVYNSTVAHRGHSFSVETHSFSVETRCYFMEISLLRAILLLFCHEKPFLHTNTQFLRGNTRLLRGRTQLLRGKTYGGPNGAPLLRRKTCLLRTNACLLCTNACLLCPNACILHTEARILRG